MHLFAMPMGSGAHVAGWRHPLAADSDLHGIAHYRAIAEIAERGLFDALFLADAQGFRPVPGRDAFARLDALRMDPVTILAALSTATSRLGLIATLSTSYNEPYSAARRLATLDHLSGGRAGWNVVTSTTDHEARNFGRDAHFGHAERYARAEEFVAVARGLWDGWDDGAVAPDRATGRYSDPEGIHALRHVGAFFRVEGPLTMGRPPQGHPVIVQAGSSGAGLDLAARSADVVFTSHPSIDSAVAFYRDLKARVASAGRAPDALRILTAIQPIVADSEAEASAIAADLDALIDPALAIAMLEMQFAGFDLSPYDPDGPLPPIPPNNASQGSQQRIVAQAACERLSLIQIARQVAAGRTSRTVNGAPEQVADLLADWFAAGAADGFVIAAPILPDMLARFVDGVVPVLQARGLFRTAYAGTTLRDHLDLPRPAGEDRRAAKRPQPGFWSQQESRRPASPC
ncbi:LLM class flavin-dependent oxidoreductase [uncultured Sphingomonas sp.]|uniref:LLM class flavin-dependent oxidoreductase n=1 Tax=uncultured Sphingomonas sp. TaxID=158754 RepID=UPI0035CB985D